MSPTVTTKNPKQKEVIWEQYRLCLAVAEYQICSVGLSCVEGHPSGSFIIWAVYFTHLDLHQSHARILYQQNLQIRAVLGDCISRTRILSIQAPQYRQHALISDFLDLAHLNQQQEAALVTNWIKDRPEGLKIQNLAFATVTGPAMSSLPKNITADVQHAINKCESLGSGEQFVLHGNPPAIAQDFSPHMAVLRRYLLPNMQFECCMVLQGTLGGDFDIFAASGESIAWVLVWKTRSRPTGVRVCPVAQFNFFQHFI